MRLPAPTTKLMQLLLLSLLLLLVVVFPTASAVPPKQFVDIINQSGRRVLIVWQENGDVISYPYLGRDDTFTLQALPGQAFFVRALEKNKNVPLPGKRPVDENLLVDTSLEVLEFEVTDANDQGMWKS